MSKKEIRANGNLQETPILGKPSLRVPTSADVRRTGNSYIINNLSDSDDDIDNINEIIDESYQDSISLSKWTERKAVMYKTVLIFFELYMIVASITVGILSLKNFSGNDNILIASSAIAFSIAGVQGFLTQFPLSKKSIIMKESSSKIKRIARDIRTLKMLEMPPIFKMRKLNEYIARIDDYNLRTFSTDATSKSKNDNSDLYRYYKDNRVLPYMRNREDTEIPDEESDIE